MCGACDLLQQGRSEVNRTRVDEDDDSGAHLTRIEGRKGDLCYEASRKLHEKRVGELL